MTLQFSLSQQGRVLSRLRGVRRRGGDDGAAEAVHGLAARLLLRASEDGEPSRAGLPPSAAPARSVPRGTRPLPAPVSQGGAGPRPPNSWSMAIKTMRFGSRQSLAERFEYEHI